MPEEGKDQTKTFTSSMDGSQWAKAFLKVYESLPAEEGLDEGFVTGWFANAIMRGYDEGVAQESRLNGPKISSQHVLKHIKDIEERRGRERLVPTTAPAKWYHAYGSLRVAEAVEKAAELYERQHPPLNLAPIFPVGPAGEACQEGRK